MNNNGRRIPVEVPRWYYSFAPLLSFHARVLDSKILPLLGPLTGPATASKAHPHSRIFDMMPMHRLNMHAPNRAAYPPWNRQMFFLLAPPTP